MLQRKDVFELLLEILKVHEGLPLFSLRATFLSRKFSCSPETCNAGEASVYFPCPDINRTALVNCSRDILHSNNRVAAKERSTWATRLEICGLYFKDGAQSIYSRWKLAAHLSSCGSGFFQHIPQILDWIGIWGLWKLYQSVPCAVSVLLGLICWPRNAAGTWSLAIFLRF